MPIQIKGETYYSSSEAEEYLGISRETLRRLVNTGHLQKYKQGFARKVYYSKTELDNVRDMRTAENGQEE